MIPLRDDIRSRSFPAITWALIALNSLVFLYELGLRPAVLARFVNTFGMVPASLHLTTPLVLLSNPVPLITLFTSAFLHSGWVHLLSNMWTLGVFGRNVEDRLGRSRFLSFYMLSAFVSSLLHALVYPQSRVPAIGASGAIAGVLGGYILFFPQARVLTLVPVLFVPWFFRVRAIIYLGFWFLSQVYAGLFALRLPEGRLSGVAWWAHVGGFLFGLAAVRLFEQPPKPTLELPNRRGVDETKEENDQNPESRNG